MGGDGEKGKVNSYVYGFSPNGKEMQPQLLNGSSNMTNVPGGIYIYDTAQDDGASQSEKSLNQNKSFNKFEDFHHNGKWE